MAKFARLILLAAALCTMISSVSCTRDKKSASVSIRFAGVSQAKSSNIMQSSSVGALSNQWSYTSPTSLSEIDCYAIFIGAPESGLQESSCKNGNNIVFMRYGIAVGLFDRTNAATIDVKAGSDRTIYVLGLKKIAGTCEAGLASLTFSNYSRPYLLASKTVNLSPGNVELEIQLESTFTTEKKVSECNFSSGIGEGTAPVTITQIATAYHHTCTLKSNGLVKCWGLNGYGQLGTGDTANRGDAANELGSNLPPIELGGTATQIVVGAHHNCALMTGGSVKCWGGNQYGQLGQGDTNARGDDANEMGANLSTVSLGTGRTAVKLAAGNYFNCAILDNGTVKCWGANTDGQLGAGDNIDRGSGAGEMGDNLLAINLGGGLTATKIFAGVNNACAILSDGSVKCWGSGANGAIGDNNSVSRSSPTAVSGLGAGSGVETMEIGYSSTCARVENSSVKCWGSNTSGQLGDGTSTNRLVPTSIPSFSAHALSLGSDFSCAALLGNLKCWGNNGNGQLGLNNTATQTSPTSVESISAVTAFSLGTYHTCAIIAGTQVKCWGDNSYGQLGAGDTTPRGGTTSSMSSLIPVDL